MAVKHEGGLTVKYQYDSCSRLINETLRIKIPMYSYNSFRDLMCPEEAERYDKYWQRDAPDYNTPNSRIKFYKEHKGIIEESIVIYDKVGGQTYRVDYTNHGRTDHSNPHLHEYIFGSAYDSIKEMR